MSIESEINPTPTPTLTPTTIPITIVDKWYCYLLVDDSNTYSYIGVAKNSVDRRLAQHNREKSGGAKATAGKHWRRICYISNFPNNTAALQFEWKWKNLSKNESHKNKNVFQRRINALYNLVKLSKPTLKAVDYSTYPEKLCINIEEDIVETCLSKYNDLATYLGQHLIKKPDII